MSNNRRDFFKSLGTAAAGVAAISPLLTASSASGALTAKLPFRQNLVLSGANAGALQDSAGGDAVGEVITSPPNGAGIVKKHIGAVRFEEISLNCGADMEPALYQWMALMLDRVPEPRNGAIVAADLNGVVKNQLTFLNGMLTEVTFPALSVGAKEVGSFHLRLRPEITRVEPPPMAFPPIGAVKKARIWRVSDFQLEIGGIPAEATARVSKIDAIRIKQNVISNPGELRDFVEVDSLEVGNIVFTVSERFADPLIEWHRNFVVQGNAGDEEERYVVLRYLSPTLKDVLFTLFFTNVGIIRASRFGGTSKRAAERVVEVELYAEAVSFFVGDLPSA